MSWLSKAGSKISNTWKKNQGMLTGGLLGGDSGGGYDYNPVGYTPGTATYQQPAEYQKTSYMPTAAYQATQPGQAAQYQGMPLGAATQYQQGQYNPYQSQSGTNYEANLNQMMTGKLDPAQEQMLNNRLKQNMAALNESSYGMPGGAQAGLGAQAAQENALQGSLLGLQQKETAMGQMQGYLGQRIGENQFGANYGQAERQFGANLGEQQRQFGANYNQQAGQFGATLGEQQRQYNTNTAVNQNQFGYGQAVNQNQFGANFGAQQNQFGYNAGVANNQYQFENARDEERRAQDWAQRQRELDAQYASAADQRAASTSQGIWSTLGNFGGQALGGWLGRK